MSKKILAVDDSRSIRQMVKFTLEQAGFEVVDAIDGNDGLSKLNEHTIDLVITDLIMPGMDGIELITRVRQKTEYKFIPIIVLTTESNEEKNRKQEKPVLPDGSLNRSNRNNW